MATVDELNERFGLGGAVRFEDGPGGLMRAAIASDAATSEIFLQGAHVTAWQPRRAEHPVIFLSPKSHFAPGKAIRGGVPLVFPWFAERKGGLPGGMHGFARTLPWEVVAVEERADGVALSFKLLPNQATRDLGFDYFVLVYEVVVGATLSLSLEVENVGDSALIFEEALHSYYSISNVRQIEVNGLGDTDYLDRAHQAARKHLPGGPIRFAGETDQLHLDTQATVTISDLGWGRRIVVEKHGSNSTVVWNPWVDKATALADLGAEAWPHFVCVEPANAAENAVTLEPGGLHRLGIGVRAEGA
jgi:glucose-6-phosphate 1-epimerase